MIVIHHELRRCVNIIPTQNVQNFKKLQKDIQPTHSQAPLAFVELCGNINQSLSSMGAALNTRMQAWKRPLFPVLSNNIGSSGVVLWPVLSNNCTGWNRRFSCLFFPITLYALKWLCHYFQKKCGLVKEIGLHIGTSLAARCLPSFNLVDGYGVQISLSCSIYKAEIEII
ncbi:hypothetical protein BDZ91DRAFT_46803 [Kalaharituber pfeilii]|nr:hypothetical protein BDZ91DRAFT_46803 [Kalaharituber pfeilii]